MQVKIFFKKNILSVLILLGVFAVDRISKQLILNATNSLGELNIKFNSILNFNLVWNEGIAFGLLSFKQPLYYNFITILIILVTLFISLLSFRVNTYEKYCFLIIIGGSLGNIFDRLYYRSVIDFIDINIKNYHWFIFNVADIFISIGVMLLIFQEFLRFKKK